jgi:adenosine deaminase CECR1
MHVRVAVPLSPSNLSTALPEFKALNPAETAQFANAPSLTSDSYALSTWVPIQKARQEFQFGGPEGFDKWVMAGLTINPSEAYGTHNTPNKIWEKFKSTFGVCGVSCSFDIMQSFC